MKIRKLVLFFIIFIIIVSTFYVSKITISGIDSSGEKGYLVFLILYPITFVITIIAMLISFFIKSLELMRYKILLICQFIYYVLFLAIMAKL